MTAQSTFRGHAIHYAGEWRFADGVPVADAWRDRPCGHCGQPDTPDGHDGCLGRLSGVANACCGHGDPDEAYVQFADGRRIAGRTAKEFCDANAATAAESEESNEQ